MNTIQDRLLPAIDARAAREAAQWLMRFHSGKHTEADRAACDAWRAANPAHELAWQRAELVSRTLGLVPLSLGMPILDRPSSQQRRATMRTVAMLIVAGPMVWTAYRATPWKEWAANNRTATGEIRSLTLADGTRLTLNTDTAVDIVFDDTLRLFKLHSGEIHIETAVDVATPARPFVVQTENGRIRAIGTRFSVRKDDTLLNTFTRVAVSEGAVEVRPAHSRDNVRLIRAGSQVTFTDRVIAETSTLQEKTHTWINGVLLANDTPLSEIIEQVSRYRSGILRCHPAIADLRVSGAFQLKDTNNLLHLLQSSLPIRIHQRTHFWVSVEPA